MKMEITVLEQQFRKKRKKAVFSSGKKCLDRYIVSNGEFFEGD